MLRSNSLPNQSLPPARSAQLRAFKAFSTLVFALLLAKGSNAFAFGLDDVTARARDLASKPYRPPATTKQTRLLNLSYDHYRDIRFKPSHATWGAERLPFELQYFHVGRGFTAPLEMHEIVDGAERALAVPRDAFEYGRAAAGGAPIKPELAGFRLHYPMNNPESKDEVIAFLGASYFRAIGAEQHYGLSARGLAVDVAGGKGEEFPAFEAFWIERPAPDAKTLTLYALLNSPRVTGAYRFVVQPGKATVVDVQARLFLRAPVATLGIAPLTSMYLSGENQPLLGDFRPEVHDSDGLQVVSTDGEWLWRPLTNPKGVFTTSFTLKGVRGFGLMQRDRAFTSYEDTEARYDRRPSVWIEPQGDWGPGRVELMQYYTKDETNDNAVAYWVPAKLPPIGQPLELAWRMHWQGDADTKPPAGWVAQSRRGQSFVVLKPDEVQYVVDFVGGALTSLKGDAPVQPVVTTGANAKLLETNVYRHAVNGGWRMTVKLRRPDRTKPVELRAFLKLGSDVLTETWSYALPPE